MLSEPLDCINGTVRCLRMMIHAQEIRQTDGELKGNEQAHRKVLPK